MSAEQTLTNRRAVPEAGTDGTDTKLVSFDLAAGDHAALGKLMNMNQLVLSGLMVSTSELEELCALAREHGALGAKLTGGGGGGSVIALVAPSFAANGEADRDRETEAATRIIEAWRTANPRYSGFVTRIRASSSEGAAA